MISAKTQDVRALYETHPYPNPNPRGPAAAPGAPASEGNCYTLFCSVAPALTGKRVLDAGCGTGHRLVGFALDHPQTQITGLDISSTSIQVAAELARANGLENLRLVNADITTFRHDERYDAITSIGVLHHLPDPVVGVHNLAAHLANEGMLALWLYHTFGEWNRVLERELVMTLATPGDLTDGLSVIGDLGFSMSRLRYGGVTPLTPNLESANVDAYLNPIVHTYRFAEALDLLRQGTLEWALLFAAFREADVADVRWSDAAPPAVLDAAPVPARWNRLDRDARLRVLELLYRPTGFLVFAGRGDAYKQLAPAIQSEVIPLI